MADAVAPKNPNVNARLVAIGDICTQWSYLEYLLAQSIWQMLKINRETGIAVTGGRDILLQAKMAEEIAKSTAQSDEVIKAFSCTEKKLRKNLIKKRNRAVHGIYFQDISGQNLFIEAHRGKNSGKRDQINPNELILLGKEIHDVAILMKNTLVQNGFQLD